MKRLMLGQCSRLPAPRPSKVNRATHHYCPSLVIRMLLSSFAVPGPVVVCQWRMQLLLSYAVRLSTHATSTGGVIFHVSSVDDINFYGLTQVKGKMLHVSSRLLVRIVECRTTAGMACFFFDAICCWHLQTANICVCRSFYVSHS
jgi:hypothetical protein